MRKWTRPVVFAVVAAALAGGAMTAQEKKAPPAQAKKDDKKDDKKEVKGKLEYYEGADGWRIRVLNADGKTILHSVRGVAKKDDILLQIEQAKAILTNIKPTEGEATKKVKEEKEKDAEKKEKKDKK